MIIRVLLLIIGIFVSTSLCCAAVENIPKRGLERQEQRAKSRTEIETLVLAYQGAEFFSIFELTCLSSKNIDNLGLTERQIEFVSSLGDEANKAVDELEAQHPDWEKSEDGQREFISKSRKIHGRLCRQAISALTDDQLRKINKCRFIEGVPRVLTTKLAMNSLKISGKQKNAILKKANQIVGDYKKNARKEITDTFDGIIDCLDDRQKDILLGSFGTHIDAQKKRLDSHFIMVEFLLKFGFDPKYKKHIPNFVVVDNSFRSKHVIELLNLFDLCDAWDTIEITQEQEDALVNHFEAAANEEKEIKAKLRSAKENSGMDQKTFDSILARQLKPLPHKHANQLFDIFEPDQRHKIAAWDITNSGLARFLTVTPIADALDIKDSQKEEIVEISKRGCDRLKKTCLKYSKALVDDTLPLLDDRQRDIVEELFAPTLKLYRKPSYTITTMYRFYQK